MHKSEICHFCMNLNIFKEMRNSLFLVTFCLMITFSRAENENSSESPASRIQGRVSGGQNAHFLQFPWHLSIRANDQHICSGALITGVRGKHFALTTGNCLLLPGPSKTGYPAHVVTVIGGRINLNSPSDYQQERKATKLYSKWADLDRLTHKWDLAVIALDEDFQVTDAVTPINIPAPRHGESADNFVTVSGWGYQLIDDYGKKIITDRLQFARIPIFDWDTCYNKYYMYYGNVNILSIDSYCAGSATEGACLGDEGSPVVAVSKRDEIFLWGIYQWKHGTCPDWAWPGIYANVGKYVEWIDAVTVEHYSG